MSEGRAIAIDRLRHMAEAVKTIESYASRGRGTFNDDPAIRDAILYQIVILGEAAKAAIAADPSIAHDLPEVEWSPIVRMRDRVAHHYWATDREVVWSTVTDAVPELGRALASALERLQ
jgi:uncharacterized protein with HEPN domain